MKRLNLIALSLLIGASSVFAGGLVTNTNQSAAWIRTLTRDATLGVDAVYYNPAGLVQLENGLHLSISNQSIFQTRTITSDYPFLIPSPKSYEAELTAPIFPSIYAAYNIDKWSFSAGFNIIGGGGTADFQTGLPSFEIPVSSLVPYMNQTLAPLDALITGATGTNPGFATISGYNMDASFTGSSTYYGVQVGASYAINDMISVSLGGRYVMAKNSYEGALTNITIDAPAIYGGTQTAGDYTRVISSLVTPLSPEAGAGLDQAAAGLDAQTADQYLKATQSGSGFTPIIGINVHLSDRINLAARYEHHTKIELTNDTEVDDVGLFPDGAKTRGDLPGMFALGADISPIQKLKFGVSFNYYLDKGAYYGNTDDLTGEQINNESTIDENAWTLAASVEYRFLGIFGASLGYNIGTLGVNDAYQSDLSYSNKSTSIGGGVFVELGEIVTLNAGYVHVMYDDYTESFEGPPAYNTTYGKATDIFAIGIDLSF